MSESAPSPAPPARRLARPRWLDTRLVLGLLLVLVSVVAGARLLRGADAATPVWVVTRDLAAGTTLREGDLEPGRVRLFGDASRYVLAQGPGPVGYVLARGVGARELLPASGLLPPEEAARARREVAVPVEPGHLPDDLAAGQQVDVYVTPGARSGSSGRTEARGDTRLVLAHVPVASRAREQTAAARAQVVVLSVAERDAPALVAALQTGAIDLVRLPRGAEPATADR